VSSKQVKYVFAMMQQTLQAHAQMNLKIRKKSSIKKKIGWKKTKKKPPCRARGNFPTLCIYQDDLLFVEKKWAVMSSLFMLPWKKAALEKKWGNGTESQKCLLPFFYFNYSFFFVNLNYLRFFQHLYLSQCLRSMPLLYFFFWGGYGPPLSTVPSVLVAIQVVCSGIAAACARGNCEHRISKIAEFLRFQIA